VDLPFLDKNVRGLFRRAPLLQALLAPLLPVDSLGIDSLLGDVFPSLLLYINVDKTSIYDAKDMTLYS
jgi:hypothetical protein